MLAEEWTHEALNDQQLIEAVKNGNRTAFDKLWRKYELFVRKRANHFAWSLNYQERKDFVDDCVVDLCEKIWERMNKANKQDIDAHSIQSYFSRCVRNYFCARVRIKQREKKKRIIVILTDFFGKNEIEDQPNGPLTAEQFSEMMQCIERKMNEKPTEKNAHDFEILETILYENDASIATTAEKYGVRKEHVEYVMYTKFLNVAKECAKKVF